MRKEYPGTMLIPKDALKLYYDIYFSAPDSLYIEGFQSIKEFSNTCLKLRVKGGLLTICGCSLRIIYFDDNEIQIKGAVKSMVVS